MKHYFSLAYELQDVPILKSEHGIFLTLSAVFNMVYMQHNKSQDENAPFVFLSVESFSVLFSHFIEIL